MTFAGLSAAGLVLVLAGAGILTVLLYFLKIRRRRVAVPFAALWEALLSDRQATRLFASLKRWLSLLLALLVVALLAFALADPRLGRATLGARTLVLLVDASASMQATDVAPSRFDRAKRDARALVAGLGLADRALVVQMGTTPRPMSPMTEDPSLLLPGIDALRATDGPASLARGVAFAADVLRDAPGAEIVILSDGQSAGGDILEYLDPALPPPRISYVPVGGGTENLAITAFSVRRYPLDPSESEALIEVWNPTDGSRTIDLDLVADGTTLETERLTLEPGTKRRRFFRALGGTDRILEARVRESASAPNALATDDRAFATLPPRRRARVLSVTDGDLYVQAALLLDEYLDVTEVTPAAYTTADGYDVVLFDNFVPPSPPAADAIYVNPVPSGSFFPLEVTGTIARPFFDRIERDHPLLRSIALRDVNVAEALLVRPLPGDVVVAADVRGPLLIEGERLGHGFVALTFDARKSDLPLRVAWPLLLLNTIDHFVHADAALDSAYRAGEPWLLRVPDGVTQVTITDPARRAQTVGVEDGRAAFVATTAGLYEVRVGTETRTVAVQTDAAAEGAIRPRATLELRGHPAVSPSVGTPSVGRALWPLLVLLVVALLVVEWLTYHRRWTV